MRDRFRFNCTAFLAMGLIGGLLGSPARADSEDEPIRYSKTAAQDSIAVLQKQIDQGKIQFTYDPEHGYLESLLKNLNVPPSSQGLVFSKTSFQRTLISPHTPRALYFNDDVYVGYVQNAPVLELASMDRNLGTVFYILKQDKNNRPKFLRLNDECLQCHESGMTRNVPGLLMRSVYPDLEGQPILSAGTFASNDSSPFNERWGGWYVTGILGKHPHMGNVTCEDEDHPEKSDFTSLASGINLSKLFRTEPYLRNTSDAVALMVLTHQKNVHNLITAANYETRIAIRDSDALNKALGDPPGHRSDGTISRIRSACEPLVRALLFCREAEITDPVRGTSGFSEEFAARGPFDSKGRSLRQFDLTHRLFKYPCSYLIYSDQFNGLPVEAKQYVYRRLWDILTGDDESNAFAHLSNSDRRNILQILMSTKQDLPGYWKLKG